MAKRYYSHRRNPVHRSILAALFQLGPRRYRHRRGLLGGLLSLFGIEPRRTNYRRNQYYAPRTGRRYPSESRARSGQSTYEPRGAATQTVAERHAQEYRRRTPAADAQSYAQPRQRAETQAQAASYPASQQAPQYAAQQYGGYQPRKFHSGRPSSGGMIHSNLPLQATPNQQYQPLPRPTGQPPYHLALESVLPPQQVRDIQNSGRLMLHMAGDTGGVKTPESQQIVAMAMETHFTYPDHTLRPAFFYHLGDVVYYYGEPKEYYAQFYDPYVHYPAPIFAIPGNHDGDLTTGSPPSLTAFVENFCAPRPYVTKEAGETERDAMTQPNVYWTLLAPFATIVGLYSNVPEGGRLERDQVDWFINELRTAPPDKALLLAVHHPLFSGDTNHSGSTYMLKTIDAACQSAGRWPDAVFTAHVHNYQRFTRNLSGRHIPYIVAGAGGYWHLHYMAHQPDGSKTPIPFTMPDSGITLEQYCDDRHGFLRLMVTPHQLTGEYFACPRPHESWRGAAERIDGFVLDLHTHKLVKGTDLR